MTAFTDTITTLEWALDLLDMYDKRLAQIDGGERVYTQVHIEAKELARRHLAFLISNPASGRNPTPESQP